ncbi:hypothetical protein HOY80DRAFT_1013230 [Tuber brumale]|nr:hypothetical protein HOY80DRAFT_1013230 [Tuber brumale]
MAAIQADSLSPIVNLADHPPQYINPDAPVLSSLMLYIVRVPGSQDLFLTTLHPLRSTVTAEDVNACLYYIHVEPVVDTSSISSSTLSPPLPRPPSHRRWSSQSITRSRHPSRSPARPIPTMTIVRRDPATGAQWNVARISSPGNAEEDMQRILVDIMTAGYQRFVEPAMDRDEPALVGFRREMWMEGAGFWSRVKNIGHKRGRSTSTSSDPREKESSASKPVGEKMKKRGYVFDALWSPGRGEERGRCGFKDEAGGKLLKCKYYPPTRPSKSSLLSVLEFKPPSTTVLSAAPGREASEVITSSKSKLGMLVCHSDGLYMMDLLVAANMAVFWKRWEGWALEKSALGGR